MKPYYRKKGRYADGRIRWIIEQKNKKGKIIKSLALPKPEILMKILDAQNINKFEREINEKVDA